MALNSLPDENTVADFGGNALVDAWPIEDPATDVSATNFVPMISSVAAMTHIVPRAYVVVVGNASTPTVLEHNSAWGSSGPVIPTLLRNGTGDITITWPATVTGEDGQTHTLNLKRCVGWNFEGTVFYVATVTPVTANSFRLRVQTMPGGAANDFVGVNCVVLVR